jgi:hypothetical protein
MIEIDHHDENSIVKDLPAPLGDGGVGPRGLPVSEDTPPGTASQCSAGVLLTGRATHELGRARGPRQGVGR